MRGFIGRREDESATASEEVAGGRGGGHVGGYPAVIGSKLYCSESRVTSHDVDAQTTMQRGSGALAKVPGKVAQVSTVRGRIQNENALHIRHSSYDFGTTTIFLSSCFLGPPSPSFDLGT